MIKRLLQPSDLSEPLGRKQATVLQAVGNYVYLGIIIIQGLLLVPLYLHYIGANTYGLWLASGGILGMLALVNLGIGSMLLQKISGAYGQQNLSQAGTYFINGMAIYVGICFFYGLIGMGISAWLPELLKVTGVDAELLRHSFQVAILATMLSIINECLRSLAQALLRPVVPIVSMITGRILGICVTVLMLFNDFGLWAIPVGMLLAESLIFVLNLLYAIRLFSQLGARISLDRNVLNEYMQTTPALFGARLGTTLSQESEPLLITLLLSPEITTAYMITRRAGDIVAQMLSAVYGATHGGYSNLVGADPERARKITGKIFAVVFSAGLIGFVVYTGVNSGFISVWVGQTFSLDQGVIFLIGVGLFIRSLREMLWQLLSGWGDFIYPSYIVLAESFVRLVLMLVFLNWLGVAGVPLALILSGLGAGMILWRRLRKYLSWHEEVGSMVRLIISVLLLFCFSFLMVELAPNMDTWPIFVICLGLMLAMTLLLFALMNWRMCQSFAREIRGRIF